jgi:hypothetical protein
MHLPTTTIVLPLKLDKVKPVAQQLSSIHPEVVCLGCVVNAVICNPLWKIKRLREHNMYYAESAI